MGNMVGVAFEPMDEVRVEGTGRKKLKKCG